MSPDRMDIVMGFKICGLREV